MQGTPIETILGEGNDGFGDDNVLQTKEKVYDQIIQYLEIEGYPTEADMDFKEGSINNLVCCWRRASYSSF